MILVTGASGHVGNVLVRKLLEKGEEVTVLLHSPTTVRASLTGLDIKKVEGDIRDYNSLVTAFAGVDMVYHCAATISIMPGDLEKLRETNVEGVKNVMKACREVGVSRVIHISSVEAIGDASENGEPINESYGFNPDKAMLAYGITKAEGSLAVQYFVKEGMDIVTVCPVGVIGPYDFRPSQMGQMILDFESGNLPAYPGYGGFDFVDTRDLTDGIVAAAEKGKAGDVFLLTSEHITMPAMMDVLTEITGKKKPKISLPYWLMYGVGFFAEQYYKVVNAEPVITRDSVKILKSNLKVDGTKAAKELGFKPRSVKESMADQLAWIKEYQTTK
ncbi:SDR family oxidoreductase [bacterium]|nr:SDR family oxidoreductase [bacterium]